MKQEPTAMINYTTLTDTQLLRHAGRIETLLTANRKHQFCEMFEMADRWHDLQKQIGLELLKRGI